MDALLILKVKYS